MNWIPPSVMRVKVSKDAPAFWLPLFLLWPLWLLTLLFCFGALFVVAVSVGRQRVGRALDNALECTRSLHELGCAIRGSHCDVSAAGRELSFSIE